ncbi:hypothetical protein ACQEVB_06425 [Pseudonocardia sp. CA-107938]|uniref:hypothetical protein n=1 Tax=Pseudonocardia sp. CA-107938 TaxID=3240021 RepID=UPI003D8EDE5B
MLDVGPSGARGDADADLAVFVDRIAAAGSDPATGAARTAIRAAIGAGTAPPGLRKLAEGLAASLAAQPPLPRHPGEDSGSIVSAVRNDALVVLDGFSGAELAEAVAGLVADGRRVVVTGPSAEEIAAVRAGLPAEAALRALDGLPALPPARLRELRRLVATSTARRRARGAQQLPPVAALPPVAEIDRLCTAARRSNGRGYDSVIASVMSGLAPERRDAVVSVARCVRARLDELEPRDRWAWAWSLLTDLIYGRHQPAFERMLEDTAQAVAALERTRTAVPAEIVGPLPGDALDLLYRYRDFLTSGGRSRAYFRSAAQRDVQPVLRLLLVDGHTPGTVDEVSRAIEHVELGQRLARVDAGCAELQLSPPMGEDDLHELADGLVKVAAAVRSVTALRHDVLFLGDNSPLAVPDVEAAGATASAILEYAEHGSGTEAGIRLDELADALAATVPAKIRSSEHERAVIALRQRDAALYADAVDALAGARRDAGDARREDALMGELAAAAPRLAEVWQQHGRAGSLGFVAFSTAEELLAALPAPDSADVVVVVGAAGMGVERLLLAGVAPRLIAVLQPGEEAAPTPSMLSVLHRAAALVIRGRTQSAARSGHGRVVRLDPGERRGGVSGAAAVG